MPRKKQSKVITPAMLDLREVIASNIRRLIEHEFPAARYKTESAQQKAVAKAAGVTWSSIQRWLNCSVGPSSDSLSQCAHYGGATVAKE